MPARDHSLPFRQGLVERLRADPGLIALVGARIYGERPKGDPDWPYVLVGTVLAAPYAPSMLAGSDLSLAVHCFVRGPSADQAYLINKAVWAALDERAMTLPGGTTCMRVAVRTSEVISDAGSPTDWHGLVFLTALTAERV